MAVRWARALLRAAGDAGVDARRIVACRAAGSRRCGTPLDRRGARGSRPRNRRCVASSATRPCHRRRSVAEPAGNRPRAGAPCSRPAPCSGPSRRGRSRCVRASSCLRLSAYSSSTQVSLVPPPWLELTTREPLRSATRVRPPGARRMRIAEQHERTQIEMARRDALVGDGRTGRERERRLGDVVAGLCGELLGEGFALLLRRGRPDEHAVAAGAVHLLDDQRRDVVEDVGEVVGAAAVVGLDILEDGRAAGIEFDDLGHVAVDGLVVGDAGARRVDDGDATGPIEIEETGNAEHGIGPECQRVEESVVDAAVDDVDLAQALRRLHHQAVADNDEVLALDQLDAHAVGEESVLEVGAVVLAGRQHGDRRLAVEMRRRDAFERRAQVLRIALHRRNAVAAEEIREHVHHRLAVLQHVGDAGRRARVVLEHEELVLGRAHDVDADDVGVDAARRLDIDHLGQECLVLDDQVLRDAPGLEDLLAVIDVVDEGVERAHALLDAGGEAAPLGGREHARDDVERDEAFAPVLAAVDGEGDAGAPEQGLRLRAFLAEVVDLLVFEPLGHIAIRLAAPPCLADASHLVECHWTFCRLLVHAGASPFWRILHDGIPACRMDFWAKHDGRFGRCRTIDHQPGAAGKRCDPILMQKHRETGASRESGGGYPGRAAMRPRGRVRVSRGNRSWPSRRGLAMSPCTSGPGSRRRAPRRKRRAECPRSRHGRRRGRCAAGAYRHAEPE